MIANIYGGGGGGGGGGGDRLRTTESNTSEERKITDFIACFWSHNWIDKANAGQLLQNPVAPQNNFKNAQAITLCIVRFL